MFPTCATGRLRSKQVMAPDRAASSTFAHWEWFTDWREPLEVTSHGDTYVVLG